MSSCCVIGHMGSVFYIFSYCIFLVLNKFFRWSLSFTGTYCNACLRCVLVNFLNGAYHLDLVCHSVGRLLCAAVPNKEVVIMKNSRCCPKCHSNNIVRVPDDAHRYLTNSICITKTVTVERIPVARYVCCDCGYVENWVENRNELDKIKRTFGWDSRTRRWTGRMDASNEGKRAFTK